MSNQAVIKRLKKVIAEKEMKFAAHITIQPDGERHFIAKCAVCAANGIVSVSRIANNSTALQAEIKRINFEHKSCAAEYTKPEPDFTEPADIAVSQVKTQVIGLASTFGEREFTRTVKAVEKAVTEFSENETARFTDGVLTFISRDSGRRRVVTRSGCSGECECGNQNSYHKQLWAICAARANVRNFPQTARANRAEMMKAA